jgi:hypothetical protein
MADQKISALTAASTLAGTEVLPIVQSGSTRKVATDNLTVKNIRSNASTGILQITGPSAGTTRGMTVPNADFTVARTDASQTFTGVQAFTNGVALNATSTMNFSGITGNISLSVPFPNASNAGSLLTFTGTGDFRQTVKLRLNKDQADNAPVDVFQWGPGVDATLTSGNLVIGTSGKGIDFSATGQATGMTSELFSDYEEGTWTATLKGSVSDPTTPVTATGRYTRVGRLVTISVSYDSVDTTGAVGDVTVTGLPFNNSTPHTRVSGTVGFVGNFPIVNKYVACGMDENATAVYFNDIAGIGFGAALQHSAGAGRFLRFEITYYAA